MTQPVQANQMALWETRDGTVRELHLCDAHLQDLVGALGLAGVGCSSSPSEQPCEVCENDGDWPVLTYRDRSEVTS